MKIFFLLFFLSNSLVADLYRVDENGISNLTPVQQQGISTPDYLIMAPNVYGFNGPSYDCKEEGIYLYSVPPTAYAQRIVYEADIPALMHSITWLHAHGYKDDNLSFSNAMLTAKTRKLLMTCGSIVQFANNMLNSLLINNRFILLLTLDQWNSYNNGHSLLEVYENERWVLYDIDIRNYFKRDQEVLNAIEFVEAVAQHDYEMHSFSDSPSFAFGDLNFNGYDYSIWLQSTFLSKTEREKFYARVAQIVLIREDGNFYFTCETQAQRARIESYSTDFIYMSPTAWMEHFYPED
jgi:hypothetical protein